jgi:hypothetical protein
MTDADDLAESVQRLYEQARDEGRRREAESQARARAENQRAGSR